MKIKSRSRQIYYTAPTDFIDAAFPSLLTTDHLHLSVCLKNTLADFGRLAPVAMGEEDSLVGGVVSNVLEHIWQKERKQQRSDC